MRWIAVPVAVAMLLAPTGEAEACGCFAPPDPASAVNQAGERILFSVANGQVTAIIQIQYAGEAADFGWLLPLPSVPTLEVSADEVFGSLLAGTSPVYRVTTVVDKGCNLGGGELAGGPPSLEFTDEDGKGGPPDPLVYRDSVGPYDFAVLKADDKSAMLDWMAKNRFFVPAGTDEAITPYMHPGAYFLALKLKSGQSAGDIQPVVVRYASDLPMIPITLTSVTSTQDMGVWVWVLGPARAIPRNYHHSVLNSAALAWGNGTLPGNYEAQVTAATLEAPGHHTFFTEMAAPMAAARALTFPASKFGNLDDLRKTRDALPYLQYLRNNGYTFTSTLVAILEKHIKQPPAISVNGQTPTTAGYYYNFAFWLQNAPEAFVGFDLSFDPVALTGEIETRIVKPTLAAAVLFDGQKYLTRLHTRLSPGDMNSDPVFSFNPDLPDVSNIHDATYRVRCGPRGSDYTATLTTDENLVIHEPAGGKRPAMPASLRIETLSEAGPPTVVTDNLAGIRKTLGEAAGTDVSRASGGGCRVGEGTGGALPWWLAGLGAVGWLLRRRRPR